ALVTAGAVEVDHSGGRAGPQIHHHAAATQLAELPSSTPAASTPAPAPVVHMAVQRHPAATRPHHVHKAPATTTATTAHKTLDKPVTKQTGTLDTKTKTKVLPGRTQTQTVATVLPAQTTTSTMTTTPASTCTDTSDATTSPTTTSTSTTPPETSSDPGSTTTTTTQSTTPGAASDTPGAASDTTGTSTDSSTPTTTSTSPAPTPAPAMDGGTSCASYSSGASDSTQPPSGGTAP
ncbi:MAG: hypothetical protein WAL38_21705, partial [Solirubrobacteraceae bacterium]